jgi:hypothetical protein
LEDTLVRYNILSLSIYYICELAKLIMDYIFVLLGHGTCFLVILTRYNHQKLHFQGLTTRVGEIISERRRWYWQMSHEASTANFTGSMGNFWTQRMRYRQILDILRVHIRKHSHELNTRVRQKAIQLLNDLVLPLTLILYSQRVATTTPLTALLKELY